MNSNNRRGQSGVDMVMTYGWIFIVGIGAVIIMSQMGTYTAPPVEKTQYGFSQVMPVDWGVYMDTNRIVTRIENWAGDRVNVTGVHVSIAEVTCESAGWVLMNPGGSAIVIMSCSDSPSLSDIFVKGSGYTAEITITYVDKASGETYISKGTVRGPVEEGSVTTTTTTPQADLTVPRIYLNGGDIWYTIGNPSLDKEAPASTSNVTVWDSSGALISSTFRPALLIDPDTNNEEDTGLDMATCPTPGEYFTVGVYADWPRVIPEYNEDNNYRTETFLCPGPDQPPVVELISPCDCCDENGVFLGCP